MNVGEKHINEYTCAYFYGSRTALTRRWKGFDVTRPYAELYYVIDGEIVIADSGGELIVGEGEMVLVPPNLTHSFHLNNDRPAEKYWIHFNVASGDANAFGLADRPAKIVVHDRRYVEDLFERVISLGGGATLARTLDAMGAIMLLAAYFADCARLDSPIAPADEIARAIEVAETAAGNVELTELAAAANLSVNYFIRKFRRRTGLTPMKYVNTLRLERAKSLLETTDRTVGEIMTEVGYTDAAYFSKLFKAGVGCSPSDFRRLYGVKK